MTQVHIYNQVAGLPLHGEIRNDTANLSWQHRDSCAAETSGEVLMNDFQSAATRSGKQPQSPRRPDAPYLPLREE